MAAPIIIDGRVRAANAVKPRCGRRGGASIEFVWSTIALIFVMMFLLRLAQVTIHGSAGLVNARRIAFSTLNSASYASDVAGSAQETPDAYGKRMLFQYVGPNRHYPYGLSAFDYQVKQGVAVYLQ